LVRRKVTRLRSNLHCPPRSLFGIYLFILLLSLGLPQFLGAQKPNEPQTYARTNSFGVSAAYSPDSSHIILGIAEQRKLWGFGVSYGRLLWSPPIVNWRYEAEVLPLVLVGDPKSRFVNEQTSPTSTTFIQDGPPTISCSPITQSYVSIDSTGVRHTGVSHVFCHDRQWTAGQAISPLGLRWNFLPGRKLQPMFAAHVGYMYSTRPVPVESAGSFNFVFDFGPGLELYCSRTQSLRLDYRIHHISNHNSATENPGIDNGLFQVSYVFGR
jgi:Lipid A 3-O-deacylase (PagL)